MRLQNHEVHPHGLTDSEYDALFTKDKPIIFAFHGYPALIHQLTYKRHNRNIHVHGYDEEGAITTPFDMRVLNKIDRYHLVIDALKYVEKTKDVERVIKMCEDKLKEHKKYIEEYGVDMPEIVNFTLEG